MLYWVIYDISNNRVRSKVARSCKNYGLIRVQKSSFLGSLSRNKAEMLALEFKEVIENDNRDAIFIIPNCKPCSSAKIIMGHLDEEKIRDKDFYVVE